MSFTEGLGGQQSQTDGVQGGNEPPPVGQQSGEPPATPGQGSAPQEPDYSLASDFLQRVPEADRATVEKYVRQWDAGVTRRFQELHGKYQPYEQLGDPESLMQALQVMRLLDEQPKVIYDILMDDIQKGAEWAQGLGQQPQQQQSLSGAPSVEGDAFQGLPPEFMQQFQQQQTILEQLATIVLSNQQAASQAAEDQELDSYLANLHTEFGDFDEDYVLARMERGEDGAAAVQAFQGMIQAQLNQRMQVQEGLPPILSGGGAPPVQQQSVTSLDKKATRNLVAELMSATNGQGN